MQGDAASPLARARLSAALAGIFRGKFCDRVLPGRHAIVVPKGHVIYDIGEPARTLYFIRAGFVKLETITEDGHELIYDLRKAGDVVGELCAIEPIRSNRAVALEPAQIIAVPFDDILEAIHSDRALLGMLIKVFCGSLADAYTQLVAVALGKTPDKLARVLVRLGREMGRPTPYGTEITARLTQEDIAGMVAVSRERLSTAMNVLRSRGLLDYSRGGHIVIDLPALETYRHADAVEPKGPAPRLARGGRC